VLSDPNTDGTGRFENDEAKLLFYCAVFLVDGLAGDAGALDSDIEADAEPRPEPGN
jgi:hypothetical protein